MRRWSGKSLLMIGAVVLVAACSSSSKSSSSTTTLAPKTSTTPAYGATTTTAGASSTTAGASSASASLKVVTNTKLGTKVIVATSGKTVYLFVPDATSTTSKVPAAIKTAWPAVTATGTPTVGPGLVATKVTVQPQPDGTKQVAYNGHLLYTFQGDSAPGTAKGQGLGGVWYVVSPSGDKVS